MFFSNSWCRDNTIFTLELWMICRSVYNVYNELQLVINTCTISSTITMCGCRGCTIRIYVKTTFFLLNFDLKWSITYISTWCNDNFRHSWLTFSLSISFIYVITTAQYHSIDIQFSFHSYFNFTLNQQISHSLDWIKSNRLSLPLESPKFLALLYLHSSSANFDEKLNRYLRSNNNAVIATHLHRFIKISSSLIYF